MPELPEVEALVQDLSQRLAGRAIVRVDIAAFSCLKTYDPPISALSGGMVDGVTRHGKFLDIDVSGTHLVLHLARAGWVRWKQEVPPVPPRPSTKSPLAARIVLDNGSGLDITEAGTRKSLALYVVRDPSDVEGIARLGPDPLADEFTVEVLGEILGRAGRAQIKGVLRHQGTIAGIGNAYSDELLHAAKLSPFKPSNSLTESRAADAPRRHPQRPRRRGRPLGRAGRERAQGREEEQHGGARPDGPALPGLRRHRARGQLRGLQPAVLPHLPDRRQAARRPAHVTPAEVAGARTSDHADAGT